MLVAAAVCPHPPLLVPDVAAGAAGELDDLREACDRAVEAVLAASPDLLVLVGDGERTREHPLPATGSLAGYGVDLTLPLPAAPAGAHPPPTAGSQLPLSLTIGGWLLSRAAWAGDLVVHEVAADEPAQACRDLGTRLAGAADSVAMLVMGDASARRSAAAPGYQDPRAEGFDAAVADALVRADPGALLDLDPQLAAELLAAGRPAWQVLAGAAGDDLLDAAVLYDRAPYGVGYLVAVWERHG